MSLKGKRVAILAENLYQEMELWVPYYRMKEEGAEVKVVAIGQVEGRKRKGEEEIVTSQLTYFARMADAATFADQASAQTRRRGVERAKEVCAIQDGAEWIQGFVQDHRHDALRILDAGACCQVRL